MLQRALLLGTVRVCFPQELFEDVLSFWPVDRQAVAAKWQGPALPSQRAAALGRELASFH